MDVRPIRTEADYDWALAEIARYFENEPAPGTPEADRFDVLAALIESYEAKHWPIEAADPVEAIQFAMEQRGYSQADLAKLLNSRSRASEILNRKRPLTMQMAHKLCCEWGVPAEALIVSYHMDVSAEQDVAEAPNVAAKARSARLRPVLVEHFQTFWGKARPGTEGPRWHPLWMHSLDVAAVGWELAAIRPRLVVRIAERLGWEPAAFRDLWVFLLALHDIGKFSQHFQAKAPNHWPMEALGPLRLSGADPGHPAAGAALLFRRHSSRNDGASQRLATWFPGWGEGDAETLPILFTPILGHHGRPAARPDKAFLSLFAPAAEAAAFAFADTAWELLQPPALPEPLEAALRHMTWPLAGLTVIADWVGSNRKWFPYAANGPSLDEYWEAARKKARDALAEAGLAPALPARAAGFRTLTGIEDDPTPVQAWAENVPLPPGPLLVLVEDMTAGGKTEAALVLAHRLMAEGRAGGIYFALPTMATANAMFNRVRKIVARLYAPDMKASLALAHGRADLHPAFRPVILAAEAVDRDGDEVDQDGAGDEDADSAVVAPDWLRSETRKALLADLGVGTIDQALLSVLPVKYQALRLAGLAEKVLIVDEAHAYDAYMGRELERLVAFQAALGGSTIILSATLPMKTKGKLAEAWCEALKVEVAMPALREYPAVTLLAPAAVLREERKEPRSKLRRTLRVSRLPDAGAAVVQIAAAARAGAAVAWVRNTVEDVIVGAAMLRAAGIETQIFHARFAMGDRLDIETDVVSRFGKDGTAEGRRGRVLVASQIIEQSLDVDFDLVVSDLAPVDLLLQRAGRLWRHPKWMRPVDGPTLFVVSPDPEGEVGAGWYRDAFPLAQKVYAHHVVLWRGARELFRLGTVCVPKDVRGLIEAVYGPGLEQNAPEALQRNSNDAVGKAKAARAYAGQTLLEVEQGYEAGTSPWLNEGDIGARLSEKTRTLRLARLDAGAIRPWYADPDPKRAWALSEVTVREAKLKGAHAPPPGLAEGIREVQAGWGRFEKDMILLSLEHASDGSWIGMLYAEDGTELEMRYSETEGLRLR